MKSALVVWLLGLSLLLSPAETSQRSCSAGRIHKSGKACGERLNKFLHDVLKAREDLSWIDQVAGQMRSTKLFQANPDLQEKLNAMFFNSEARVWAPEKKTNVITHQRYRRHSKQTKNSSPRRNGDPTHSRNVLANKKNSNSPKREYNAESLLQRNFNSTMKSTQKIRTKNGIATTADPLEKILQSINVFPVEDDRDARDGVAALKFNDDTAKNDFQSGLFEHETARASPRASSNEAFSEEHSRMRRSLKSTASGADTVENDIAKLFKSEYDTNKAQNEKAMSGDLAREIVEAIFDQLRGTGGFDAPVFVSQHYTRPVDSMLVENFNLQKANSAPTNENEAITRKIMTIVQQLISEEVEKKSCALLKPELRRFLKWLIDVDIDNNRNLDILREKTSNIVENKPANNSPIVSLDQWYQKAESFKKLLNEYDGLSKKEKSKVQAIYEYLVSRFEFAEAYIKALESHELPVDQLAKIHID